MTEALPEDSPWHGHHKPGMRHLQGHPARVPTKSRDVLLHPLQGQQLGVE